MVKCFMCPNKGDIQLSSAIKCPGCKNYYHESCSKRALELGKLSNGAFIKCCSDRIPKVKSSLKSYDNSVIKEVVFPKQTQKPKELEEGAKQVNSQSSSNYNPQLMQNNLKDNDGINMGGSTADLSEPSIKMIKKTIQEALEQHTQQNNIQEALEQHTQQISNLISNKITAVSNQVTDVRNQVSSLITKFEDQQERIDEAFHRIEYIEKLNNNLADNMVQKVITEVEARKMRECNIILYNIPESDTLNDDLSTVKQLFETTSLDLNGIKIYRLGKTPNVETEIGDNQRMRPLKVQFNSVDNVSWILKNKNSINWNGISFSLDKTLTQRALHREAKKELQTREANGENDLYIKYVNGLPTVINRSKNNSNRTRQRKN